MIPIDTELRNLIAEARANKRSLHSITREAGVNYFRVYGWVSGRSVSLDMVIGDNLLRVLRGKGQA